MIFSDHDFNYLHRSNEGIDQDKASYAQPKAGDIQGALWMPKDRQDKVCRGTE
jgi:hypothetical protein